MELRLATGVATALSLATITICVIGVPMIYSEIQSIWQDLDSGMVEFNVRQGTNKKNVEKICRN